MTGGRIAQHTVYTFMPSGFSSLILITLTARSNKALTFLIRNSPSTELERREGKGVFTRETLCAKMRFIFSLLLLRLLSHYAAAAAELTAAGRLMSFPHHFTLFPLKVAFARVRRISVWGKERARGAEGKKANCFRIQTSDNLFATKTVSDKLCLYLFSCSREKRACFHVLVLLAVYER